MAVKEKELEIPKEKTGTFSYSDAAHLLLERMRTEKEDIEHQTLLRRNELKLLSEAHVKQEAEFNKKLRANTKEFEDEKNKLLTDLANRGKAMEVGERELKHAIKVNNDREMSLAKLSDVKIRLNNERLEVEKLRGMASGLMDEATRKIEQADSRLSAISIREGKVDEKHKEINKLNSEVVGIRNTIDKDKEETELVRKNLEKLRSFVEPKIKEVSLIEENTKKRLDEIKIKDEDATHKLEESRAILRGIEAREKKVKEKEREVLTLQEEVMKKKLLIEANKLDKK